MATTTNYGWTTPDDTALVKDGASAIRALGTAIDTSMNTALGTKKSGLVLLNTTSFSAVASQSINDVFSATYDSYLIIWSVDGSTTATAMSLRVRVSGTDNSSSNYSTGLWGNNSETATIVFDQGALTTSIAMGAVKSGSEVNQGQMFIHNPFSSTKRTQVNGSYSFTDTNYRGRNFVGSMSVTTSYTGFTVLVGSGTITGSVSTYGVQK